MEQQLREAILTKVKALKARDIRPESSFRRFV